MLTALVLLLPLQSPPRRGPPRRSNLNGFEHFRVKKFSSQGQNLALTDWFVPDSLDSVLRIYQWRFFSLVSKRTESRVPREALRGGIPWSFLEP